MLIERVAREMNKPASMNSMAKKMPFSLQLFSIGLPIFLYR
jgi:hypothetical protein